MARPRHSRALGAPSALAPALAALVGVGACGEAPDGPVDAGAPAVADAGAPAVVDAGAPAAARPPGWEAPLPAPAAVVAALTYEPYVERSCVPTTYPGWPYEALACTYGDGLRVTVANPSPERVAGWIVDAAAMIPHVAALAGRDRARYEAALVVIAKNVTGQSTRIFPLTGQVLEDKVYRFEKGVTRTCVSGCYCRINSLDRGGYCAYAAAHGGEPEGACRARLGTSGFTAAWADQCLANHAAAWIKNENGHFRARLWGVGKALVASLPPPDVADPARVVEALARELPP